MIDWSVGGGGGVLHPVRWDIGSWQQESAREQINAHGWVACLLLVKLLGRTGEADPYCQGAQLTVVQARLDEVGLGTTSHPADRLNELR
jgi:hypothetical protein